MKGGFIGANSEVDFVSGPVSVVYFPDVYGKRIYIFGDWHYSKEGYCKGHDDGLGLEYFLARIFRNTRVKIDFFMELSHQSKVNVRKFLPKFTQYLDIGTSDYEESAMTRVRYKFEDCFFADKTKCPKEYKMTRFHYVNIRTREIQNGEKWISYDIWLSLFYGVYSKSMSLIVDQDGRNAIEFAFFKFYTDWDVQSENFIRNFNKFILLLRPNKLDIILRDYIDKPHRNIQFPKIHFYDGEDYGYFEMYEKPGVNRIKKQLDGIDNPKIKAKIREFYQDRCKEISARYSTHYIIINSYVSKFPGVFNGSLGERGLDNFDTFYKHVNKLFLVMLELGAFLMDIYTLARIFKKSLADGREAWIYVGDYHKQIYMYFITNYLNITDYLESDKIDERCQEVGKIRERRNKGKFQCNLKGDSHLSCSPRGIGKKYNCRKIKEEDRREDPNQYDFYHCKKGEKFCEENSLVDLKSAGWICKHE